MQRDPKFYIRRFPCWGGSFVYCVAECGTRKVSSSMFRRRQTAETLMGRMEADWQRWLDRGSAKIRAPVGPCDKAGVNGG